MCFIRKVKGRGSILLLVWCLTVPLAAQTPFRVLCYNVENLFDCQHDTLTNDYEFLPESIRHWTPSRYRHKLNEVAKVIASAGETSAPELVGLCEVENDTVLTHLTRRSLLRTVGYRYVMTHGNDPRGIDIALLYKPTYFHPITVEELLVPVQKIRSDAHARPVLYVCGELPCGDTLDVVVCHWPSKVDGSRRSEPLRLCAAEVVYHLADSIAAVRQNPYILMMGDLNETPCDAAASSLSPLLCNLSAALSGTYRYRGRWEQLDQLFVSPQLMDTSSRVHVAQSPEVLTLPRLLEDDVIFGGQKPIRTYHGMRYKGGVSDHLPVLLHLTMP